MAQHSPRYLDDTQCLSPRRKDPLEDAFRGGVDNTVWKQSPPPSRNYCGRYDDDGEGPMLTGRITAAGPDGHPPEEAVVDMVQLTLRMMGQGDVDDGAVKEAIASGKGDEPCSAPAGNIPLASPRNRQRVTSPNRRAVSPWGARNNSPRRTRTPSKEAKKLSEGERDQVTTRLLRNVPMDDEQREALALGLEKDATKDKTERQKQEIAKRQKSKTSDSEREFQKEFPFKPKLNKASQRMCANQPPIYERYQSVIEENNERREKTVNRLDNEEMNRSKTPRNALWKADRYESTRSVARPGETYFGENWKKTRDDNVRRMREAQAAEELAKCVDIDFSELGKPGKRGGTPRILKKSADIADNKKSGGGSDIYERLYKDAIENRRKVGRGEKTVRENCGRDAPRCATKGGDADEPTQSPRKTAYADCVTGRLYGRSIQHEINKRASVVAYEREHGRGDTYEVMSTRRWERRL